MKRSIPENSLTPFSETSKTHIENKDFQKSPVRNNDAKHSPPYVHDSSALQMYTEEEVAAILRVSLSQLRKWRVKGNKGKLNGPPFKKLGRLVRYSAKALQAYINNEE